MKKNHLKKLSLLGVAVSILLGGAFLIIPSKNKTEQNIQKPAEFKLSKKEDAELSKWRKKTFTEMVDDALQGDPAGLHMVGECYLYGLLELPINVQRADDFFAVAASLGFPPSIDKIRGMYLDKNESNNISNILLSMVYTNLTASSGHHEYTMAYHEFRSTLGEKLGDDTVKEIEKIALKKKADIEKNVEFLKSLSNPDEREIYIRKLFASGGIVKEDINYGYEYWFSLYSGNS